jgi:hypothetical protein
VKRILILSYNIISRSRESGPVRESLTTKSNKKGRFAMRVRYCVIGLVLVCLVGCESLESVFEKEKEVPLSQVPEQVVAAAESAVEGITLTEAEMEEKDGQTVYELEGTANGKEYEIEVTADGKVLDVEEATDDKDDD